MKYIYILLIMIIIIGCNNIDTTKTLPSHGLAVGDIVLHKFTSDTLMVLDIELYVSMIDFTNTKRFYAIKCRDKNLEIRIFRVEELKRIKLYEY